MRTEICRLNCEVERLNYENNHLQVALCFEEVERNVEACSRQEDQEVDMNNILYEWGLDRRLKV